MYIQEINALYYDSINKQTIVLAKEELRLNDRPFEVIETICNRYGLSRLGSITAIKQTLNIHQKCPVLIHPILQIYLFPTISMQDKMCVWINSKQIRKLVRDDLSTVILFKDNTNLKCNVGIRSIKKQINRCEMMEDRILRHYQIDQLSLKL